MSETLQKPVNCIYNSWVTLRNSEGDKSNKTFLCDAALKKINLEYVQLSSFQSSFTNKKIISKCEFNLWKSRIQVQLQCSDHEIENSF